MFTLHALLQQYEDTVVRREEWRALLRTDMVEMHNTQLGVLRERIEHDILSSLKRLALFTDRNNT